MGGCCPLSAHSISGGGGGGGGCCPLSAYSISGGGGGGGGACILTFITRVPFSPKGGGGGGGRGACPPPLPRLQALPTWCVLCRCSANLAYGANVGSFLPYMIFGGAMVFI